MPVIYRLSVEDYFAGGLTFAEGKEIAAWAAEAGADALHITAGHYRSLPSAQIVLPPMTYPDATFVHFAAGVKKAVRVPVIAVGRLGDPATATAAVAAGQMDFIALGRTLIADPQWVEKLARAEPIRRCLACNTCINEMRGGARIGCVVNGAAGRETMFSDPKPPREERIAVIGAGPAGLSYASLVADGNQVTVFEKAKRPGGAFRHAGKAPLFQEVEASEKSFERYISDLVAACVRKGVKFRFETDIARTPALLAPFDRIVVATGAHYRFGLGPIAAALLDLGAGRWPGLARIFSRTEFRDWFYYKARKGSAERFMRLAKPGQIAIAIGDAVQPGKSKPAIASAFEAALLGRTGSVAGWSDRPTMTERSPRSAQLRDRQRDDLGRRAQVIEPQILVGVVRVRFQDRARSRAVEHDRDAGRRIMASIGVERHPGHRHVNSENSPGVMLNCRRNPVGAGPRSERRGQQESVHIDLDPWMGLHGCRDQRAQLGLDACGMLLRDDPAIDPQDHLVRHHVGVDTALDQPDVQRRRNDARRARAQPRQSGPVGIEPAQDGIGRLQGIDAALRHGGMRLLAGDRDLEVQAAVVGGDDRICETCGDGRVGPGQALLEQPLRADDRRRSPRRR